MKRNKKKQKPVPTVHFRVRNANGTSSVTYYVTVGGTITVDTPFEFSTGMAEASGRVKAVIEVVEVR